MFAGYENLTEVKSAGSLDTSGVTNMSELFWHCKSLTALDLSGWDISNVTNMSGMFNGCTALESLNVSGWDTSRVTDMSMMFYCCSALRDYDPKWVNATQADKIMMYFGTKWQ
ncbi:MAG: DUF285 domain-containing protein [Clostridiales bacterium]|nr:DUF285 domain-containing protein [Clostridiales bacterium]